MMNHAHADARCGRPNERHGDAAAHHCTHRAKRQMRAARARDSVTEEVGVLVHGARAVDPVRVGELGHHRWLERLPVDAHDGAAAREIRRAVHDGQEDRVRRAGGAGRDGARSGDNGGGGDAHYNDGCCEAGRQDLVKKTENRAQPLFGNL